MTEMGKTTRGKTIFWNVDTQYDFMRPDGKLYVKDAETIEPNLEILTQYAKAKGIQVVSTADWHTPGSEELSESPDYKTTFPQHCMQRTRGAEFVHATRPSSPLELSWHGPSAYEYFLENESHLRHAIHAHRDIVLYKDKFDVFAGSPYADKVVDLIAPSRAIVYGVATNVCVDYAVRGLLERKVEVYVVQDAIKELPNIPVEPVYESWRALGARFTTTKEVLSGTLEERL
jgi:nicotinamidase/pyrazinamidase